MTYKYSIGLTVAMVGYLSPWWASWVWEDQIILNVGLEQCLIRPSLTFPFSGYLLLLRCYYQKIFLGSSLLWVRLFPRSHTWAMTHICQDARVHFEERMIAIALTSKKAWGRPNCVFKRIVLSHPPEIRSAQAIFHFFFPWKHRFFASFRMTLPCCHSER